VNVGVAALVDRVAGALRAGSRRSRQLALVMRRASALVFVYLAVQLALGQRSRP
jgi:threonine/homoserine/homoserine lactone efflux protein